MARSNKSEKAKSASPDDSRDWTEKAMDEVAGNAAIATAFVKEFVGDVNPNAAYDILRNRVELVKGGDLDSAEAMLTAQAAALNSVCGPYWKSPPKYGREHGSHGKLHEAGAQSSKPITRQHRNIGRYKEPARGVCATSQLRVWAPKGEQRCGRAYGQIGKSDEQTIRGGAWNVRAVGPRIDGLSRRKRSGDGGRGSDRRGRAQMGERRRSAGTLRRVVNGVRREG